MVILKRLIKQIEKEHNECWVKYIFANLKKWKIFWQRIKILILFKKELNQLCISYITLVSSLVRTMFLLDKPESAIEIAFICRKKWKMTLKLFTATVSNFDSVFEKFRSEIPQHKANLILFLADNDPSTSLSWCPGKKICLIVFYLTQMKFLMGLSVLLWISW